MDKLYQNNENEVEKAQLLLLCFGKIIIARKVNDGLLIIVKENKVVTEMRKIEINKS